MHSRVCACQAGCTLGFAMLSSLNRVFVVAISLVTQIRQQQLVYCSTILKLSTYGGRCFSVYSPTVWNSLSDYLRDPTLSVDVFRRYYPHMPIGNVWIGLYRLRFFLFFFCNFVRLQIFFSKNKVSDVKFCMVVRGRLGQRIFHFGELCSPKSQKSRRQILPIDASPLHWRRARRQWRGLASTGNTCLRKTDVLINIQRTATQYHCQIRL